MTETTALAHPGTPANLADKLKDKIRLDLAELMDEDQWKGLLESAIRDFTQPRTVHYGYNNRDSRTEPSHLNKIVHDVLTAETKTKIQEMLRSKEWAGFWDGKGEQAGKQIKEFILENSDQILLNLLSSTFQSVVSNMASNIGGNNGY